MPSPWSTTQRGVLESKTNYLITISVGGYLVSWYYNSLNLFYFNLIWGGMELLEPQLLCVHNSTPRYKLKSNFPVETPHPGEI